MADFGATFFLGRVARVTIQPKRATFKLAVSYRSDGPTHWFDVVAFNDKQISVIRDHVKRGRLIHVQCRPQTRTWEQEGKPRKAVEFVLEHLTLLPKSTMPAQHDEAPEAQGSEPEIACEQEPGIDEL